MDRKKKKGGGNPPLVICDFDGTVSSRDVGHEVLRHFSGDRWADIDRAYVTGKIGSRDAYSIIASIVKIRRDELCSYLDGLSGLDPFFGDFYEYCTGLGMGFKIVSDGLDFYIREILSRNGLGEIEFFANSLGFGDNGSISINFPYSNDECRKCGTCKSNILAGMRQTYSSVIYVGDGHSDVCPAKTADLVFGKETLYRKCLANGTSCIHYTSFDKVHEILKNGSSDLASGADADQD